jgi:hypothetical protein
MSLDVSQFLKDYVEDIKSSFPEFAQIITENYSGDLDTAAECTFFEQSLRPHFMKILQKDDSLFAQPVFILRGVDITPIWAGLDEATKDTLWKYIRLSLAFSFFGGEPEQQLKSVLGLFKSFWTQQTGKSEEEIEEILNNRTTQNSLQDIMKMFTESKIAGLITEMIETIRPEQLGLEEFNITDIQQMIDLIKNPDSPILRRATSVIGEFLERKIQTGAITKQQLVQEIEMMKARMTSSLRRALGETLFGEEQAGPRMPGHMMTGGSPEARRARMVARMQRKYREKGLIGKK